MMEPGRSRRADGASMQHAKHDSRRVRRERRTIEVMIRMYCRAHHEGGDEALCPQCLSLNEYAMLRIDKCPFCPDKPTCANCPIHCYKRDRRAEVREVMRYAGPRMLRRHPILGVLHILDGFRKVELPARRSRAGGNGRAGDDGPPGAADG
jgi:hypothetical protein